jgi:tetratricopeptide (TPR) repeat protein
MKRTRRAALFAAVICAVLMAGCGKTYMQKKRDAATDRWATSQAEISAGLAKGCFERGELGRARDHLDEAMKTGAPYAPMYVLAARLAVEKGELDAARRYAEAARNLQPDSAEAWYVIGTIEQTLERPDLALAAFSEAAKLAPEKTAYALAEVELLVAQKQKEEAARRLNEALGRTPGSVELHAARGDLLCLMGNYPEAVGSYRIARRLAPRRQDVTERLATALFYSGDYAEAEPLLADMADAEPEKTPGWVLEMWGDSLLSLDRLREARPVYERILARDGASVDARVALAKCDLLEDRPTSARHRLDEALQQSPDDAEANALMGLVLIGAGRAGEAVPHLRLALAAPDCGDRKAVERLLALATAQDPQQAVP